MDFHRGGNVGDHLDELFQPLEVALRRAGTGALQQAAEQATARAAQVGQTAAQAGFVHSEAQAVCGGFFEVVRLVDDDVVVVRHHPIVGYGVGDEQRVVDDDDVGRFGCLARLEERARAGHLGAAPVQATPFVLGAQALPGGVLGRAA